MTAAIWIDTSDLTHLPDAIEAGVQTVSIMIYPRRDAEHGMRRYAGYSTEELTRYRLLAAGCRAAGMLRVGLTVWAQPRAAQAIRWLVDALAPDHLCLDAEEPWTRSLDWFPQAERAYASSLRDLEIPVYVTTILYAPPRARALVQVFGGGSWIPQVYTPSLASRPDALADRIDTTDHVALPLYHRRGELDTLQTATIDNDRRWYWSLRHYDGETL